MVDNVVKFYSGYIQIQAPEYKDNRSINNTFEPNDKLVDMIGSTNNVTHQTSRLESFALASSGNVSQGAIVIGIDPEQEQKISGLKKWVNEGEYLAEKEGCVLVGEVLAENLDLQLNDSIILLGQGYHGVTAAGLFRVKGFISLPNPELNRQIIYMNIHQAQEFYSAYNRLTSMIVMVNDVTEVEPVLLAIETNLSRNYSAYSWAELQPELVQFIDGKQAGGKVFIYILFMIIAFGILGTVIMLMAERKREFGVMISLGMSRIRLVRIMLFETFWISLLGVIMGVIISFPIIRYLIDKPIRFSGDIAETFTDIGFEPILVFSDAPFIFYNPAIIVFIITLLISIYPILFISRMNVVNALRA